MANNPSQLLPSVRSLLKGDG
ncbi:hypothetical protein CFP56_030547 [Quercus suber]|uniref:Uncharacterized protein n=1 Tax=Quercus suber TaxID=58331 RepID=A0AAW0JMR9_QUESU